MGLNSILLSKVNKSHYFRFLEPFKKEYVFLPSKISYKMTVIVEKTFLQTLNSLSNFKQHLKILLS